MRKWLALVVPVVLLVTIGPRLVAVQEQAVALRQAVGASLERDDVQVQTVWKQVCNEVDSRQSELSCLWLYLSTEGEEGRVPRSDLEPELVARYAYAFGWWAEEAGASDRAAFSYQFSLNRMPSRQAADRLAGLLLREEREAEAVAVRRQVAVKLPTSDPDHWWLLARAAEMEQDWERAASAYGRGAQLAEWAYHFWNRQGRAFQQLQAWDQAEQAYWRAFWVHSIHHVPCRVLGETYLPQEQYVQAGRWFWTALQFRPSDSRSNYYVAQVLHRVGKEQDAVTFLARAVTSHQCQMWRWAVELGDWRLTLGDRDGALEAYRQALEWRPGEASIEERIEQVAED